jgi:hypothetical protein
MYEGYSLKRWRIETGIAEAGWNMAVDEALLYSLALIIVWSINI